MKRILPIILLFLLASQAVRADESRFYFKVAGGGSYPVLRNLSDELSKQGDEKIGIGISGSISLGRTFLERQWAAEVYITMSRYPTFHYENDFEDFNGKTVHYGFAFILKKCLLPESGSFIPWVGIGAGYGKTSVVSGAGEIAGFEGLVMLELEQRIRGNISLFAEGAWRPAFAEKRYSSPFLEGSNVDAIFDSDENPLNDAFSAVEFRIGVKIWLRPPKKY